MPEDRKPTPREQEEIDELLDALTERIRADTERLRAQVAELHAENEIRDLERLWAIS